MNKKIAVVGSINVDNTIYTHNYPRPGMTVFGDSIMTNVGGKGANQAAAVSFLGGDSLFFGVVGDDQNGQLVKSYFDSINLKYHLKTSKYNTGVSFIITQIPSAENSILCVPGANLDLTKQDIDAWFKQIQKCDILISQLEVDTGSIEYLFELAKKHSLTTILNPAPYHKIDEEYLQYVDYFIPNEHELDLFTKEVDGDEIAKAKYMLNKGIKHVIVTLGSRGSLLVDQENEIYIDSIKVKAIDTTGAGDSYIGAFAYALSQGKSIIEAMKYATKASSITVQRKGAIISLPHKEEM